MTSAVNLIRAQLRAMWKSVARLFVIKTKFEAFLLIYALGAGAVERGIAYLHQYPGMTGRLLFVACTATVFIAGGTILDAVEREYID